MPGPFCPSKEIAALASCFLLSTATAWCQETYIEHSVSSHSPATSEFTLTRSPIENLNKRLIDIQSWIDKGINEGWLSFMQAANFNQQVKDLKNSESSLVLNNGVYDKPAGDAMEKAVNQLSIDVGQAMKNSSVAGSNTPK
jgi:hypothetical protein